MSDPLKKSPTSNILYTPLSNDKDNEIFDKIKSGSPLKINEMENQWHYQNQGNNNNRNLQNINDEEIKENLQVVKLILKKIKRKILFRQKKNMKNMNSVKV